MRFRCRSVSPRFDVRPCPQDLLGSPTKVPATSRAWRAARKAVLCCCVFIQDQSFNNFENNTIKLLGNEAKLTGLWARNWATIQQVLILSVSQMYKFVNVYLWSRGMSSGQK